MCDWSESRPVACLARCALSLLLLGWSSAGCRAPDWSIAEASNAGEGGERAIVAAATGGHAGSELPNAGGENGDGGDGAGDGGAKAALPRLADDEAVTARGHAVTVAVLENDLDVRRRADVFIDEPPRYGSVKTIGDGRLEYDPEEGFSGTDSVRYGISGGSAGTAELVIEVLDQEWSLVGDAPYRIWRGPPPDLEQPPEARRWTFFDADASRVYGFVEADGAERAFALESSGDEPIFLADAPSRAYHVSSGGLLGGRTGAAGALWSVDTLESMTPRWTFMSDVFASNAAGVAVGRPVLGGDSVFRPGTGAEPLPVPDGFQQLLPRGINDVGAIVGSAAAAGIEAACRIDGDDLMLLPSEPGVASGAYDINNAGVVVGSGRASAAFGHGWCG